MATAACLENPKSCDRYYFAVGSSPGTDHGYQDRAASNKYPALQWPTGRFQWAIRVAIEGGTLADVQDFEQIEVIPITVT
jgi:hypothetical protein